MRRSSRFSLWLAAIAAGGLAIRIAYVLASHDPTPFPVDAFYYHHGANLFANGEWFIDPIVDVMTVGTVDVEAAAHGPAWIVLLALPSFLGFDSPLAHQVFTCLVGSGTIVAVGLLGRDLAGNVAGLLAALLASVYPNLWMFDATLNAETLAIFLVAVMLLLAYRYRQSPSVTLAVALGAVTAVSALNRAETVMFMPLVVLWLWFTPAMPERRRRAQMILAASGAFALLVLPWAVYNSTRFDHPVPLSTGFGLVLRVSNCDKPYYGEHVGFWSFDCARHDPQPSSDGSSRDAAYRRRALEYVREHWSRVPVVVGARVARTFGVYEPIDQVRIDSRSEHRPFRVAMAGLVMFYGLVAAATFGFLVLHRRGVTVLPLLAVIALVVVTVVITYGHTRFRALAEVPLVVGAAVGIDTLTRRRPSRV